MQLSSTVIAILVAAVVVVVLVSLFRRSAPRRSSSRGPSNLHFVCAGCKRQFAHTKRTVAAWERGSRRFFCNTFHRSWREANPGPPAEAQAPREAVRTSSSRGVVPARSGCLSVIVVVAVVPLVAYAVSRYA